MFTAPNSAFEQIRDNEEKYFPQSIGILVFIGILEAIIGVAFIFVLFNSVELEEFDDISYYDLVFDMISGIITTIFFEFIFVGLFYVIGRVFGGNKNWKKVCSVVFHTSLIAIPATITVSIPLLLIVGAIGTIDPTVLEADKIETIAEQIPGIVVLYITILLVFLVWMIVVLVKATKIVNGFDTGKAILFLILTVIVYLIIIVSIAVGLDLSLPLD